MSDTHPAGLLALGAAAAGGRIALVEGDAALSYADLDARAWRFAAGLVRAGLHGTTVSLLLPGSVDLVVALFGAWRAGCRVALHNADLTAVELARAWSIVAPAAVVTAAARRDALAGELRLLTVAELEAQPGATTVRSIDGPVLFLFSGGTTGTPKAVAHDAASLRHSVEAMHAAWAIRDDVEIWVSVAPMFHVYGLLFALLNPVFARATNVLCYPFRPADVLTALLRHRATVYSGGPPAVYEALLAAAGDAPLALPDLRTCAGGGAAFSLDLLDRWRRRSGVPVTEAYGMTEMAPITANGGAGGNRPGSVGRAALGVDLAVRDPAASVNVGPGTDGMIVARGPQMMRGYVDAPEETAQAIVHGWLVTGDIGHLDDNGFLFITGRLKEMISVSGFKAFPREIEAAALAHPAVVEACAIGVPDARTGEAPVLYVVATERLAVDALHETLATRLVKYKRPVAVVPVEAIPRTPANKPDRRALLAQWLGG